MGAIGGGKRRVLVALEVVVQNKLAVVTVQDKVEAGALEIGMKKEMRVGNDNGVRRRVALHGIDVKI